MIFISNKGNIKGQNSEKENHPDYIMGAIKSGFHVKTDAYHIDGKYYLGCDGPKYEVQRQFFFNQKMWVHCRNVETLSHFSETNFLAHCFFHDTDCATLTSKGFIWLYNGQPVFGNKCIAVKPEKITTYYDISKAYGICSDFVEDLSKNHY